MKLLRYQHQVYYEYMKKTVHDYPMKWGLFKVVSWFYLYKKYCNVSISDT